MIFLVLHLFTSSCPKSSNYIEFDSPSYVHIFFSCSTNSSFNSTDTHTCLLNKAEPTPKFHFFLPKSTGRLSSGLGKAPGLSPSLTRCLSAARPSFILPEKIIWDLIPSSPTINHSQGGSQSIISPCIGFSHDLTSKPTPLSRVNLFFGIVVPMKKKPFFRLDT